VILYSINPFWFYLHLQYEQIHMIRNTFQFFKNLLHGERGQDIYYNRFKFYSTTWKLFLVQSSYHWGCTIHGSKGMVVFYCVECKQSFFGCNMLILISCSFFGKIRRYFFTATFSFCSNCVFSSLDMLQYIGTTSVLYLNCDLQMEHGTFPTCWSSFKNGYSASKLSVKVQLIFRIQMIIYP
jgi:hypothetical protein